MKTIKLFLIILVLTTSMANAKDGELSDVNYVVSKMNKELNLTEEQIKNIKPIIKDNLIKRQNYLASLETEAITNENAIRQTIRQLRKEENQKLSKVLTPQQMDKLIQKQNLKDKLNQDKINYKEFLQEGVALSPQGGSFQF